MYENGYFKNSNYCYNVLELNASLQAGHVALFLNSLTPSSSQKIS